MTQLTYVTATGFTHGLINKYPNAVQEGYKNMSPEKKAECEKQRKHDNKLVKARYINHQTKNGTLETTYCKYPGDALLQYRLISGQTYELPLGFVEQVNEISKQAERSKEDHDKANINNALGVTQIHELVSTSF